MSDPTAAGCEIFYCHICGEPLARGTTGFSGYELSCAICQASYHIDGEQASYILSTFVEHDESPVVVPVAELRDKNRVRHAESAERPRLTS